MARQCAVPLFAQVQGDGLFTHAPPPFQTAQAALSARAAPGTGVGAGGAARLSRYSRTCSGKSTPASPCSTSQPPSSLSKVTSWISSYSLKQSAVGRTLPSPRGWSMFNAPEKVRRSCSFIRSSLYDRVLSRFTSTSSYKSTCWICCQRFCTGLTRSVARAGPSLY